jgi:hypothetical protein
MSSDTSDTYEIPEDEYKFPRMDAADELYD